MGPRGATRNMTQGNLQATQKEAGKTGRERQSKTVRLSAEDNCELADLLAGFCFFLSFFLSFSLSFFLPLSLSSDPKCALLLLLLLLLLSSLLGRRGRRRRRRRKASERSSAQGCGKLPGLRAAGQSRRSGTTKKKGGREGGRKEGGGGDRIRRAGPGRAGLGLAF